MSGEGTLYGAPSESGVAPQATSSTVGALHRTNAATGAPGFGGAVKVEAGVIGGNYGNMQLGSVADPAAPAATDNALGTMPIADNNAPIGGAGAPGVGDVAAGGMVHAGSAAPAATAPAAAAINHSF